jgi:benzoylsuccinyl-CoA thiolase BbsA subunit
MAGTSETLHSEPTLAGGALVVDERGQPVLVGSSCRACGQRVFPPVQVCPECLSEKVEPLRMSREGVLYSWSTVYVAPKEWRVPYVAGYVDLPEGVRVFAHIVGDAARLAMDMKVRLTVADLGRDVTGAPVTSYAFEPAV